jgi:4-amino-4-deoxychorismate lyase
MTEWLINGVPGERISVRDRGLTYGDGLFETIAIRARRPRFLGYHLERLMDGGGRLSIPLPDAGIIEREVEAVAHNCDFGAVKIIVTRGIGQRGYAVPAEPKPTRIVGLIPGGSPSPTACRDGIVVRFCDTPISINRRFAGLKTLGRLDQVLARSEWTESAVAEGLMATEEGQLICGTMTNLFHVSGGRLVTPELSRCGIRGVMRRVVMEQARRLEIECREIDVFRDDLLGANEVFVTNSNIGIWPVVAIENQGLEDRPFEIGPVTRGLMEALAAIGVNECRQ